MVGDAAPGRWKALPHTLGASITAMVRASDATGTVGKEKLYKLAKAWKERHCGIRAAAKDVRVKPVRCSPCRLGLCVCGPRNFRRLASSRLFALLRQLGIPDLARVVLRWRWKQWVHEDPEIMATCSQTTSTEEEVGALAALGFEERTIDLYAQVGFCLLRPFRPTFVEVEPVAEARRRPGQGSDVFMVQQSLDADGQPKLYTVYEWLDLLCPTSTYTIVAFGMSTRLAPITRFHGQAYLMLQPIMEESDFWKADSDCRVDRRRGQRRPRSEEVTHESLARAVEELVHADVSADNLVEPVATAANQGPEMAEALEEEADFQDEDSDVILELEPVESLVEAATADDVMPAPPNLEAGAAAPSTEGRVHNFLVQQQHKLRR